MASDRIKQSLGAFIKTLFPRIDYLAFYRVKLVAQSSDLLTVDVQPDGDKIPGLSGIPLKTGVAGVLVKVRRDAFLMVGWEGGDPSQPFAVPTWESGASVEKTIIGADAVFVGGESGAEKMLHAETFLTDVATLLSTLNTILLAGTAGSPVKQLLTQAAQFAASPEYAKIQAGTVYKSTIASNT